MPPISPRTAVVAVGPGEHQANNPFRIATDSLTGYICLGGFGSKHEVHRLLPGV